MPLVTIRYDEHKVEKEAVSVFSGQVAFAVATCLSCSDKGGSLTLGDIEIEIRAKGEYDTSGYDLEIIVFANDFPSRKENLDQRRARIMNDVRDYLPNLVDDPPRAVRGYLWVLLCPASFEEF